MSSMTWEQQREYLLAYALDARDSLGLKLLHEAITEAVKRVDAARGRPTRTQPDRTESGAPRWTFRETLEQAHVLYTGEREDALSNDDPQGDNFWASHAETVRSVLDTIELCPECEAKGLRP